MEDSFRKYGHFVATSYKLELARFSAKQKILQVPACKTESQNGYIMQLGPPTHPSSSLTHQLFSFNVVLCPHPNCSSSNNLCVVWCPPFQYMSLPHPKKVCAVSPSQYTMSPFPPNEVLCSTFISECDTSCKACFS